MAASRLIVFICSANICRSPMAEYLLRAALPPRCGWRVESAGMMAIDGLPASSQAVAVLGELDIDLRAHCSGRVTAALLRRAALLVPVTRAHRDLLLSLHPPVASRTRLLRSFDPAADSPDLEDPIGGGLLTYRHCRDAIRDCLPALMRELA